MIKKTKSIKRIEWDARKYKIIKCFFLLKTIFLFGEKKQKAKFEYDFVYNSNKLRFDDDNSLPGALYFKPTDIVIYDLISKEDFPKLKKGIIKLYKKCFTHKLISGFRRIEEIQSILESLDQTTNSLDSWFHIGYFDFAYNSKLDMYIDYFEIKLHNFSSSYVSVEMVIKLKEEYIEELSKIIKKHYENDGRRVRKTFKKNKRKSGAYFDYEVNVSDKSEYVKSKLIYEQLQLVKKYFLYEIVTFFPLIQYSKNKEVYGINVYETNIEKNVRLSENIYSALGIDDKYGFDFSEAERLYVLTQLDMENENYKSDMMYVYNPNKINYKYYPSPNSKSVYDLTSCYLENMYRMVILKDLGIRYQELISFYRNMINKCSIKKVDNKKLLKLKYLFIKDFYDYKKINEELPVDKEIDFANEVLESNDSSYKSIYLKRHTYKCFTDIPNIFWKEIKKNYEEVKNDLERKIEISSALNDYYLNKRMIKMVYIQVFVAIVTLFFIFFPKLASDIGNIMIKILKHI